MEEVGNVKKRTRDESDSGVESPDVKRLKENLLDSLDVDDDPDFCTSTQDLDSFMKSFEEEITVSPSAVVGQTEFGGVDLSSNSGESRPELGYLLEASDDELGIPPPMSPDGMKNESGTELFRVESDSSEYGSEFWDIPNYEPFGFGFVESDNNNGEYVALDGLFDYSDVGVGSGYPYGPIDPKPCRQSREWTF